MQNWKLTEGIIGYIKLRCRQFVDSINANILKIEGITMDVQKLCKKIPKYSTNIVLIPVNLYYRTNELSIIE